MLAWGFYGIKSVARFFVPLNVAMFCTALTVGGHYLIDILAGGVVGVMALLMAVKISKRSVPGI